MKLVRAQATDGRVYRAANGGYHVTGKAAATSLAAAFLRAGDEDGLIGPASLSQPYRRSVWVMAAINEVTRPLKAVSLKFYLGDNEYEDAALAAFWRRPAVGMRYEEFVDATAGWFKLRGEFFWLLGDDALTRRGRVGAFPRFIVARPDDMRHVVRGGVLLGWVWTDAAGRQHDLLPENVIHIKRWNPFDPWRGLGELDAAQMAAESDYLAANYARDTWANAGTSGDYVVAKGGVLDEAQRTQIEASLTAKRLAAMRGQRKIAFLTGDIEVKSPALTAPDASFVLNRVSNRHEVYAAFGVPMSMADVQASYSIGSASDYFRLIFNSCMPLGTDIGGAIEAVTELLTGRSDLEAWFEWDEHPTMQAVRAERVESARKLWEMGTPLEVANEYLDMGRPKFRGWEKSYLPFSVAEQGAVEDPETDPALAEPTDDEPEADPIESLRLAFRSYPVAKCEACDADEDGAPMVRADDPTRDPARVALWKAHVAARRATVKAYESKFRKVLMVARRETVAKLEAKKGVEGKGVAADFIFDPIKFGNELRMAMRGVAQNTLLEAGLGLLAEIGKLDDVWSMPPEKALEFLASRDNLMGQVADDVHRVIEDVIQQGLLDGSPISTIADGIRGKFNDIGKHRAMVIAQTETAAAYGVARDDAMRQSGVRYKQWLTSGNGNVRASHREAEQQVVELDAEFRVGGVYLKFPGDPDGPPAEIINCHCVSIAVAEPPPTNPKA